MVPSCEYLETVLVNFAKTMLCFSKPWGPIIGRAGGTGVDRWGTGGTRPPPTFQLGGDHIGNVPPTFLLKKWKISCVLSPSNLHSLSACVIDTGVYK